MAKGKQPMLIFDDKINSFWQLYTLDDVQISYFEKFICENNECLFNTNLSFQEKRNKKYENDKMS